MADSGVEALGAIASALPWPQYEQLLSRFLRLMKTTGSKFLVRAQGDQYWGESVDHNCFQTISLKDWHQALKDYIG